MINEYDAAISNYFAGSAAPQSPNATTAEFPAEINLHLKKNADLRYGENPHQVAAIYQTVGDATLSIADAEQLAGKELSYNNYVDLDSVLGMILDFAEPFACVVKHTNPCGAASAPTLIEAYRAAHDADPMSAFGSIIGLNRKVDMATAQLLHETQFVECVLAPDYDADALALLEKKKQRRLLRLPAIGKTAPASRWLRAVHGGFLYQSADRHTVTEAELNVVTKVKPTPEQNQVAALRIPVDQTHQIKCDCHFERNDDGWYGLWADIARRCRGKRGQEGRCARQRRGAGLGRIFPDARWRRDGSRRRCEGNHSAGWIEKR